MLISGFTGQLKGWWDNYLTPEAKYAITHAVKTNPNQSEPVPDTVNTLLYTIIVHFTGKNNLYADKIQEKLINLKCPTLSHFKWYIDTFFSKIYQRSDGHQEFWKEKFLSGLPYFFAERVKNRLKNNNNGKIPYDILTYGDLASEVVKEGITLCNEIK